ncbi:MAG: hypothetical protein GEU90_18425 [Gemmatimonas sp.]|nr:hypothetical protein [Gemmatimonas sp.]
MTPWSTTGPGVAQLTSMEIKYVYNTVGEYVAFISAGNLFTPLCDWLGTVRDESEVHNTLGEAIGVLYPDGRLVRDRSRGVVAPSWRPRSPLRPIRPLPPKRHLLIARLELPLEDVFSGLRRPITNLASMATLEALNDLAGADVVAHDGTFVGRLSRNPADRDSLVSPSSIWGDPSASESIFNPFGLYGHVEGPLSAFNQSSPTPPRLERDGAAIQSLTVNPAISDRIDPNAVISWLAV